MQEPKKEPTTSTPNWEFARLPSDDQITRAAQAVEAKGIRTLIAENSEDAEAMLFDHLPAGAEVFIASSQTLEQLGIPAVLERSEKYHLVPEQRSKMAPRTQNRERLKLGATPKYILGSVHAVTEDGQILIASNTGIQLSPAASPAKVIWVVGAQKIVRDLEEGIQRIEEYSYLREEARLHQARSQPSSLHKARQIDKEIRPGRVLMIIVKEELGF